MKQIHSLIEENVNKRINLISLDKQDVQYSNEEKTTLTPLDIEVILFIDSIYLML